MADTTTPDEDGRVSAEALERVQHENTQLEAEVAGLKATVADLGMQELARDHFATKGVADPGGAAKLALPHLRDKTPDEMRAAIDQDWSQFFPTGDSTPPPSAVPEPDAVQPPTFARPTPDAAGQPVGEGAKLDFSSPEGKAMRQNDPEGFKRLLEDGKVLLPSDRLAASGVTIPYAVTPAPPVPPPG